MFLDPTCWLDDHDYPGSNIVTKCGGHKANFLSECQVKCQQHVECEGFLYLKETFNEVNAEQRRKTCCLKRSIVYSAFPRQGTIASNKYCRGK